VNIDWADWVVPAVSVAGILVWVLNLRAALWRIAHGVPAPAGSRIGTLATLTVVALALAGSALIYPGLVHGDTSRVFVTTARVALVLGGLYVLWASHQQDDHHWRSQ
jgi:hypothetical protein